MAEYIEREAAIEMFEQAFDNNWEVSGTLDRLRAIPAADVVEVVRCHECIYKCGETTDIIGRRMIICAATNDTHPTDWFCKWGKRNEGGQDDAE